MRAYDSFAGRVAETRDMSSVVTKTPLVDRHLPTLQAVLEPCELGQALHEVFPMEWGTIRDIKLEVLQYHRASRCTFNIRLRTTRGDHELIGKVYATDRSDVYEAMSRISENGFGPKEQFSIPKPLAYIRDLNLLVQEKVAGPLASDIFLTGSASERALAAERCALWLGNFHTHAPKLGSDFAITSEVLGSWVRRLAKRAAQVVDKAQLLWQSLEACSPPDDIVQLCSCHGTYCHYQIILAHSRTVALDWDGYCTTDPTLDVARFLVILQQLALESQGSFTSLNSACDIFYRTYTAASKFDVSGRLPFFKAALCLKHAKDYVKRDDVRPRMAEAMLDLGLRILDEEVRT